MLNRHHGVGPNKSPGQGRAPTPRVRRNCLAISRSVLPAPAWLYGNVQVLADSPLAGERLGRFYQRWAGAREPQPGWFELDANRVCSLQDMRKRQKLDRA